MRFGNTRTATLRAALRAKSASRRGTCRPATCRGSTWRLRRVWEEAVSRRHCARSSSAASKSFTTSGASALVWFRPRWSRRRWRRTERQSRVAPPGCRTTARSVRAPATLRASNTTATAPSAHCNRPTMPTMTRRGIGTWRWRPTFSMCTRAAMRPRASQRRRARASASRCCSRREASSSRSTAIRSTRWRTPGSCGLAPSTSSGVR